MYNIVESVYEVQKGGKGREYRECGEPLVVWGPL